jgi:hypothetical protein
MRLHSSYDSLAVLSNALRCPTTRSDHNALLLLLLQIRWYDLRYVITTNMDCADNFFCPLPVSRCCYL